jgi:plasmid stabilization system protein ParE
LAKVEFLRSSIKDLIWMDEYYRFVFPAGRSKAEQNMKSITELLSNHPLAGRPHPTWKGYRIATVPSTPFALIYLLNDNIVEIRRVWDQRSRAARYQRY